jgi:hypothetical protein
VAKTRIRVVNSGRNNVTWPRYISALHSLHGFPGLHPGFHHTELQKWVQWTEVLKPAGLHNVLADTEGLFYDAEKGLRKDGCDLNERLFANPHERGQFVDRFIRSEVSVPLDCAPRADGTIATAPAEYLPLTRAIVSAPMTEEIETPKNHSGPSNMPFISDQSTDVRARREHPGWWAEMFDPSNKNIPLSRYDSLMRPVSHAELHLHIESSKGGSSPGFDGISNELLKLLCEWDPAESQAPPVLRALAVMVNTGLLLGRTPECLTMGWITMVPKSSGDKRSGNASDMRPITVLSELSKLTTRLLANRLGDILLRHPDMLMRAQRGFLRDGCTTQCLEALVNMMEDAADGHRANPKDNLYMVSYDQKKAFDSVSFFAMEAAFKRFNLPLAFGRLVMSGLKGAPSRVRTRDGLTKPFYLGSSVRQGDPLSPLIYILYMDALHTGLAKNPLFDGATDGYIFRSCKNVKISSLGYADDTVVASGTEMGIWRMHQWVRAFFGACGGKLNCDKTKILHVGSPNCTPPGTKVNRCHCCHFARIGQRRCVQIPRLHHLYQPELGPSAHQTRRSGQHGDAVHCARSFLHADVEVRG